ncbi:MAG: UDP-N-acetylmuramate dehydrogenase [Clostridia bacterium]|nr:UDP-N-acetylmuramate dehydrogenase [Clostridia bacterium]NCC42890.1 UDP-N-acetylmuramate dehydrogenase [Clostridia bacterium]
MKQEIAGKFEDIVGTKQVFVDELMKKHTTFRVGGPADIYVCPADSEETAKVVHICQEEGIPFFVLGNGSNLLVSDQGFRGVVIQIYKNMNQMRIEGNEIIAQAGVLLSSASKKAMEASLTGMEFASGIPGTLGGAVVMNAGAYGGEMKDILVSVTVLTPEGDIRQMSVGELELGYRTSVIKEKGFVVLEVRIRLEKGKKELIQKRMDELKTQRVSKQPLEYPSAGSTFKRPEGYFAGKLIQDAGLCGYQVGGAQVSEKHCGFVVNTGEATAADVAGLIRQVQDIVYEKFQVKLETEVKFLGEFWTKE